MLQKVITNFNLNIRNRLHFINCAQNSELNNVVDSRKCENGFSKNPIVCFALICTGL